MAAAALRTAMLAALLLPAAAVAQVSVNPGALDQLKPAAPSAPVTAKPAARPAAPPARRPVHPTPPAERAPAAKPAPPAAAKPKPRPVSVAPAPPPPVVLAPPVELPHAAVPPPPPVPIVADAEGEPTTVPGGVRVTFGSGKADLNPRTDTALLGIAGQLKAEPTADVNLFAYAAGVPDDPSASRRLSLSRALAARAVLINAGVVSTRIYVRALGATASDGPPDRVDVVRVGTPAPEAKP